RSAASTRPPGNTCAPPMNAMLSLRCTRKTSNGCAWRSRTTVDAGRASAMVIGVLYFASADAAELNPVSYENDRGGDGPATGLRREYVCAVGGYVSTELP